MWSLRARRGRSAALHVAAGQGVAGLAVPELAGDCVARASTSHGRTRSVCTMSLASPERSRSTTAKLRSSTLTLRCFASAFRPLAFDDGCSRSSIVRFANGPKRQMGHLLGAKKNNFFNSRYCRSHHDGRAGGILSIRGPEVSPGPPRVGTRRGQSPTPHAWALPSVHTYKQGPLRSSALDHDLPKISIQSSLESPKHCRMRRKRLPDPRPIPESVREPICPRKK